MHFLREKKKTTCWLEKISMQKELILSQFILKFWALKSADFSHTTAAYSSKSFLLKLIAALARNLSFVLQR